MINTFFQIPVENISKVNPKIFLYSTFFSIGNSSEVYLSLAEKIGYVNVQRKSSSDEIYRENKPLSKYQDTNKFASSLSLAAVILAYKGDDKFKIEYKNTLLGDSVKIYDREFPINDNGNIYLNFRYPVNAFTNKSSMQAFVPYPASAAIIYERFEAMDSKTGYYTTPDEVNLYWQSFYNNLIINKLDKIYFNYLNNNYKLYLNQLGKINNRNYSYSNALKIIDDYYYDNLNDELTRLIKMLQGTNEYYLVNYVMDNEYVYKPYVYDYFNLSNNINNNPVNKYIIKYTEEKLIYSIIPKISGIPINEILVYPKLKIANEWWYNPSQDLGIKSLLLDMGFGNTVDEEAVDPIFDKVKYTEVNENISTEYQPVINALDVFSTIALVPQYFMNKIVILGEQKSGGDLHSVPFDNAYPGPEIVATAMDNYLNDGTPNSKLIREAPFLLNLLMVLLCMLATIFLTMKTTNLLQSIVVILMMLVLYFLFNTLLFTLPEIRLWLNMIVPLIFIVLTSLSTLMYKMMIIDKDKKQIKNLFGKFVSPQILDAALSNPEFLSSMGPRKRELSVLFSDVRDFTTKSEQMNPDELIAQLNEYLEEMVEVIVLEYNGTFDKYMGDAVMAFWGDPIPMEDHARRAVLTALAMRDHLLLLNQKWEKENKQNFRIGIGINSGDMIVGHMGSPRLIDYTVLGDNVNVASRVEGLNKQFGTEILITKATNEKVKDIIETEYIGSVTVKGKAEEVEVYTVIKIKEGANVKYNHNPTLYTEKKITIE